MGDKKRGGGSSGRGGTGASRATAGDRGPKRDRTPTEHAARRRAGNPAIIMKPLEKAKPKPAKRLSKADSAAVAKAKAAKKPTKAQRELQLAAHVRKTLNKHRRQQARG